MKRASAQTAENKIEETAWLDELSIDAVDQYRKEISRIALLTAAEEKRLAMEMKAGRSAALWLERNHTTAEKRERWARAMKRGDRARKHLIAANSRLVISIAKRYRNWGVPLGDLIQEGNLGLIHAADKFDHRRGFRFSTYATWWIRQSVTRAIAEHGRVIRLPVHLWEKVNQTSKVARELEQELGRAATTDEIAAKSKTSVRKIEHIVRSAQQPLSLDTPVGEEGEGQLGDLIADTIAPDPFERATHTVLREELGTALAVLTPREERIMQLRYGLDDGHAHTLDEIGDELGFTRERIRQIEREALRKMRHYNPKLRTYLQN